MSTPHSTQELADEYLSLLLAYKKTAAVRLILDAAESATPVERIYLEVLQPAQRRMGELWQTNQASVAQEHYCTAATQLVMSRLYPRIFGAKRNGHAIVLACVGGELHELGPRMVADLMEIDGWDTHLLGASAADADILETIAESGARILGLSVTVPFNLKELTALIGAVRSATDVTGLRIIVGGRALLMGPPSLWAEVGADACVQDGKSASETAARLLRAAP